MGHSSIRGLLFDKDGTLFDFNATWAGVMERVLERLTPDPGLRRQMAEIAGFDTAARRFRPGSALVAGSTAQIVALWADLLPGQDPAAVEAMTNSVARGIGSEELVPACPDLPGFLAKLKAQGYRLGVATHDAEGAARVHLEKVGALGPFDFIAGYDSGHGLKPGPGMLHAFAKATEIAPSDVAMLGDSRHDLQMVPNAGAALAIGVPDRAGDEGRSCAFCRSCDPVDCGSSGAPGPAGKLKLRRDARFAPGGAKNDRSCRSGY